MQTRTPRGRQLGYTSLNGLAGLYAKQPAGGGGFLVDAADFDGTNDYLSRAASMTGQTASKSGIVSFWVRFDTGPDSNLLNASAAANPFGAWAIADSIATDAFIGNTSNGAGTDNYLAAEGSSRSLNTWYHVLSSWDGAAGVAQCYINDAAMTGGLGVTAANVSVPWNTTDLWTVGVDAALTGKVDGGFAEIYFAPNQYLDMTNVTNRRKFYSALGKPVDLGVTGSTPTGTAPLYYLHLGDGEAPANFATNRAGNGNFTVTGTLTTYATSPSD